MLSGTMDVGMEPRKGAVRPNLHGGNESRPAPNPQGNTGHSQRLWLWQRDPRTF
jgi:hypothetical protein